ncbi:MAG: hypothetical protein ABIE74_10220 [Pseudomonadota bacterium]
MMKKIFGTVVAMAVFILSASCGGGGGGGGTTLGDTINAGYELPELECTGTVTGGTFSSGTFSVNIAAGVMSTCVNATDPQASATATLPTGLDIGADGSTETNVTSGTTAFTFTVGERSFNVSNTSAVTITVPYSDGAIPLVNEDSLHVFVRILNGDDNSLVDVTGTVDATGNTVTIQLTGLPSTMTAVVIYNPNMAASASTTTANTAISAVTKATPTTWGAAKWCVVYDTGSTTVQTALATYRTNTANPAATTDDMMKNQVANNAVNAQNYYVAAGFRQPLLRVYNTAADPCTTLGTTARFNVHIQNGGSSFSPPNTGAVVDVKNYFGTLYVGTSRINLTTNDELGPVLASVAHEMLHASQGGYDYGDTYAKSIAGYEEGTATTYGRSIGVNFGTTSNAPRVRLSTNNVFMLDNYLTQNAVGGSTEWADSIAYSNQDFFAYVGRAYGGDNLSYLNTLFEQMKTDVAAQTTDPLKFQPKRSLLFGAMNTMFQANLTGIPTLKSVYLDFLRQRTMEHNANSQLRGTEPTTSGTFNTSLFSSNGLYNTTVDPLDVSSFSGTFGNVAPFAARAIRITPSQTVAAGGTGATIEVSLSASNGALGTGFDGAAYQNGT